ncbi:MAG: hypothetical protein JWP72_2308 [Massilia sp.]|jgi:hypothetical protein|nr:hypothetical protein [Massilia sp.]MDB5790304.1 hypothetical protein [Massilia sp.]
MRYLVALLAYAHLSAFGASETPQAAAEAFYRWVLSYQGGGLPSPEQRKQLKQLLTPEFVQLFAAASATETRCTTGLPPDIKGPVWEGNPFVSNYEGATEAWYGASRSEGRQVIIEVNLLDVDDKRPKGDKYRTHTWQDSVKLRKEKSGWLVTDVARGESLTGMLRDYVRTACGRR